MGVRFACHACDKRLNIKQELAGRRGVCPACGVRFRIPAGDAERSMPLESDQPPPSLSRPAPGGAEAAAVAVSRPQGSAALSDTTISTWYVRPPSGGQYGPATTEVLRQWIDEGRVAATSLLWREGWPQWRQAQAILPELAQGLPQAPETPGLLSANGGGNAGTTGRQTSVSQSSLRRESPAEAVAVVSKSSSEATAMVGNAQLGRQKRERSLRRTLMIGVLSLLSVTLIIALVVVVRQAN